MSGKIILTILLTILLAIVFGPSLIAGIVLAIIFGVRKHKRNKSIKE